MLPTIDVHAHVLPRAFRQALDELGIQTQKEDGFPEPAWSEEEHLDFMAQTNQAFQIVTVSSPHPHRGNDELALTHARHINDEISSLCSRHSNKLGFCTYLPLPNVQGSVTEAIRGFDELGALGVKVPSNANGMYLGNPAFAPLYEELDRRAAVAVIHPTAPGAIVSDVFTARVMPMYEFIADTTRTVIDLLMTGALDRYPNIRWVVPHCGSFVPPMAHRLMGISEVLVPHGIMDPVDVERGLASLYFDVAGDAQPVMLDALLKVADPTHVLYGSDYPYTRTAAVARKKQALEDDPSLEGHLAEVFFGNAACLFGLEGLGVEGLGAED